MGKGDKKSRRGKIILGSSGVRRPKSSKNKGFVKVEKAPAVAETKKNVEKVKAEPKPKVKEVEAVVIPEAEVTPKKTVKKAVKKVKEEGEAEKA